MSTVFSIIWSWAFILGLVVGLVGYHTFTRLRCRWLNTHRPLPDGRKRGPGGVSSTVWGALIVGIVVVYVLAQSQQTHDDTVALADRTRQCQQDLINNINRNRDISAENDELSREQRKMFAEIDAASAQWINRLINPPPDIAALDIQDRQRQEYSLVVTRFYYEQTTPLRERIIAIDKRQDELDKARIAVQAQTPSPQCGE